MIPSSTRFDQMTMASLLECDPVVQEYRAFFSLLDWSAIEQQQRQPRTRGQHGHPIIAYLKAFLVRINEGLSYTSRLRRFLLKHPLLVIELGFDLHLDPQAPYGIDCEQTLPTEVWLRARLRTLDQTLLQDLLAATVTTLQAEIPGLGETVATARQAYLWLG